MSNNYTDIRSIQFVPLSEAKAKLSEIMRKGLSGSRRLAITTNGRPTAVVLSYRDYLDLLTTLPSAPVSSDEKVITLEEWKKGRKKRELVRDSILKLFKPEKLSRKGQKGYKNRIVRDLGR